MFEGDSVGLRACPDDRMVAASVSSSVVSGSWRLQDEVLTSVFLRGSSVRAAVNVVCGRAHQSSSRFNMGAFEVTPARYAASMHPILRY